MKNMGWFGVVRSLKVTGNSAIKQSTYEFLLTFYHKQVPVSHYFWHTARYW